MSKESDLLGAWHQVKEAHFAWGQYIRDQVKIGLDVEIAPVSTGYFLKMPVEPRIKDDAKLIEKAFYRGKPYTDPINDITDKVGIRFVVLLGSDIARVVSVIEKNSDWTWTKDRDYEEEQKKNPVEFGYAAVHFVVRPRLHIDVGGISIPTGTSCEVQVKTLLQHAYSELTHDTIYKPQIDATPIMQRNAAKAMALLEATNDYFESVSADVTQALTAVREITNRLSTTYRQATGLEPKPGLLEGLLLEAYEPNGQSDFVHSINEMLLEKPFLVERIKERVASKNPIFTQPSVLLAYLFAMQSPNKAKRLWPLTAQEIEPILNDLGESLN